MLLVGELSIILQHHWRKTAEWDAWRGGREGGSEEIFVCEAVSCLLLHLTISLAVRWVLRTHTEYWQGKRLWSFSLSLTLHPFVSPLFPTSVNPKLPFFLTAGLLLSMPCTPLRPSHPSLRASVHTVRFRHNSLSKMTINIHQRGARTKKKKKKDKKLQTALWWDKVENEVKLKEIRNGETLK